MPSSEYETWRQMYSVNPFGTERDNIHFAMLMSIYCNSKIPKGRKAIKPQDFMLTPKPPKSSDQKARDFVSGLSSISKKL